MKTLLLKLSGPMQAWGTSSHFETRDTDYYPSKSAVIGIVAASFGYERTADDEIQKFNEIDFAVRVDQVGVRAEDYHTVEKYKASGALDRNYVTKRYYMEDAVFVVALSHADDQWMQDILYALKHPFFTPFMGRRSCPLPPDFIIKLTDDGPIEALEKLEWQAESWFKRLFKRQNHDDYIADIYADSDLIPCSQSQPKVRRDRVISFAQEGRNFGPRFEKRKTIRFNISSNSLSRLPNDAIDFYESI